MRQHGVESCQKAWHFSAFIVLCDGHGLDTVVLSGAAEDYFD